MSRKFKIFNNILSIVAPILLIATVIVFISYGWYVKRQQTANIDASTKNVAIEYTFDDDESKNVVNYTVSNLSFFDIDSTDENKIELIYLSSMAVSLTLNLKNNSSNNVTYKITFNSLKDVIKETIDDEEVTKSIAYIGCLFYDLESIPNTVTKIEDILELEDTGVTYISDDTKYIATYDSGSDPNNLVLLEPDDDIEIKMYLFGIQEIDEAKNDDFLYEEVTENNVTTKKLKTYSFSLTIESIPVGDEVITEVDTNTDSNESQGDNTQG